MVPHIMFLFRAERGLELAIGFFFGTGVAFSVTRYYLKSTYLASVFTWYFPAAMISDDWVFLWGYLLLRGVSWGQGNGCVCFPGDFSFPADLLLQGSVGPGRWRDGELSVNGYLCGLDRYVWIRENNNNWTADLFLECESETRLGGMMGCAYLRICNRGTDCTVLYVQSLPYFMYRLVLSGW